MSTRTAASLAASETLTTRNEMETHVSSPQKLDSTLPEEPDAPKQSLTLLFSALSRRQILIHLFPAILLSLIAGGIAPFMTFVVGQAFNIFSQYSVVENPSHEDKDRLLHGIGIAAIELAALAGGALALGSVTSSLWIWTGERNVNALRKRIYSAVIKKDMVWFDLKTDMEPSESEEDGPVGAGGMMARFSKYNPAVFLIPINLSTYPEKQKMSNRRPPWPRASPFNI